MTPTRGQSPSASFSFAVSKVLRAGRHAGAVAAILLLGSQTLQTAAANGDTRSLTFHHTHTGETLTVTYKRDGRYDPAALAKINHEMRDWRRNEEVRMDPAVIDAVWELYRAVDGKDGIDIICGYRAPATNSMLRSRSSGVAKHSQHTLGKAIDLKVRNVPLDVQRAAALRLQRGGVGYYPGSQFIHVDVASVRHWPRMTRDQLARVFPDGRTVHVPTDGKPMKNYQLALADIARRGSAPSQVSLAAARSAGVDTDADTGAQNPVQNVTAPAKNLFATLFGSRGSDPEEAEDNAREPARRETSRPARAETRVAETRVASRVPLPPSRPGAIEAAGDAPASGGLMLASAGATPVTLGNEPPRPPAAIGETSAQPYRTASADEVIVPADGGASTGSVGPWTRSRDAADRVPLELALAYAVEPRSRPQQAPARPSMMGSLVDRARLSADDAARPPAQAAPGPVTVVRKATARLGHADESETPAAAVAAPHAAVVAVKAGMQFDDPWLRAVMLAPSLQRSLTVTGYGAPDWGAISRLLEKPTGSVMMTFAGEPYPGMASDRFSGGAVVFLSTVTFQNRTASLQ